jgi:hypothetical protein
MIELQNCKYVNVLDPVSGTGAVTMDNDIDTNGYDYLTVVVSLGAVGAATTALSLSESDDDVTYAAITFADADGGTNIDGSTAAVPGGTDDDSIFVFNVNLVGRKRYIRAVMTRGGTATLVSIVGILSRANESTAVLADRGVLGMITG